MSRPFSRPRTRIYNVNYNIGENYYRPTIDRLDRKYSGRPVSPAPASSLPRDVHERHERAFQDEDLSTARQRASKHITESHAFDARASNMSARAMDLIENDIDEETASKLQRIRANRKVALLDDIDVDSTMNGIVSRRMKERSDKILDSVGITAIDVSKLPREDVLYKRRTLKVTMDTSGGEDMTKWSKVSADKEVTSAIENSAAAIRAKQSRARIDEIEDEMNMMAEKQQLRERRAARLRKIVADNAEENEMQSIQSSSRVSSARQRVQKSVNAIEY